MDSLAQDEHFFAAIDMEWSVDIENGIQGSVSLISVAFEHEIFLILVCIYCDHNLSKIIETSISSPSTGTMEDFQIHC